MISCANVPSIIMSSVRNMSAPAVNSYTRSSSAGVFRHKKTLSVLLDLFCTRSMVCVVWRDSYRVELAKRTSVYRVRLCTYLLSANYMDPNARDSFRDQLISTTVTSCLCHPKLPTPHTSKVRKTQRQPQQSRCHCYKSNHFESLDLEPEK